MSNVRLLTGSMNSLFSVILSMATSSRALKHVWTKEKDDTIVECLVDLVSMRG